MDIFSSLLQQLAQQGVMQKRKVPRSPPRQRQPLQGNILCCRCPAEKESKALRYSPTGLCRRCAVQFSLWTKNESKLPSSSLLTVAEFIRQHPARQRKPCRRCPPPLGRMGNPRGSGLCRICATSFGLWKKNYSTTHPEGPIPTVEMFLEQSPSLYAAKGPKPLCVRCPSSRKNEQVSSITGLCKDCSTLYARTKKRTGRADLSVQEFMRDHPPWKRR